MKFILSVLCVLSLSACATASDQFVSNHALRTYSAFDGTNVYKKTELQAEWVRKQNDITASLLTKNSIYEKIKSRSTELNTSNPPAKYYSNRGDVYLKAGSLFLFQNGIEKVLIDKATLNNFVVTDFKVSPDSTKVAYSVAFNGSDSVYWYVYDLENFKLIGDSATRVRIYDLNWDTDSKGFFYTKWPDLSEEFDLVNRQVLRKKGPDVAYHKLGTQQNQDPVVFSNPYISANFIVNRIGSTEKLIAHRTKLGFAHKAQAYIGKNNIWKQISFPQGTIGRYITSTNTQMYFVSSEIGNNYGIVSYSAHSGQFSKIIVHSDKNLILSQAQRVSDKLITQYFDINEFKNFIKVFDLNGKLIDQFSLEELGLPGRGTLPVNFVGNSSSSKVSFTYSAIEQPTVTIIYEIDKKLKHVLKSSNNDSFNSKLINSKVALFSSFDHAKVPLQIYKRKDISTPKFAYFYYYGSNGILNASGFNKKFQFVLELGGLVVLVGARGGGEYGADWYKQGMSNRFKTIHDVAFASRFIKTQFPSIGSNVVATGRSYGGMLTNALIAHYASEFNLFIPVVGLSDLDYYKSDYHGSIGWDDLGYDRDSRGQIIDTKAKQAELDNWSPIKNLQKIKNFDASIISFTTDNDERTGPHQTYVMTNELQKIFPSNRVFMFEHRGGHVARAELVDEATFIATIYGISNLLPTD